MRKMEAAFIKVKDFLLFGIFKHDPVRTRKMENGCFLVKYSYLQGSNKKEFKRSKAKALQGCL